MEDLEQAYALFQNHTPYYSNTVNRRGGRAENFIIPNVISEPITNLTVSLHHIEAAFIKVTLLNKTIILPSIYRPPNTNFNDFKTYINNRLQLVSRHETDLIICGDLTWICYKSMDCMYFQ